jgi:hypothetical protein
MRKFLPVFTLAAAVLAQSPSRKLEFAVASVKPAAPQTDGRRMTKEFRLYELVVGKNGPKMKASVEDPSATANTAGGRGSPVPIGKDGFPAMPPGRRGMIQPGRGVDALVAPAASPTGNTADVPNFFSAVQEQLGLKLEQKTGPLDVLIVDQAENVPTEN